MLPIMMRVKEIKHEHDFVKTFVFDQGIGAKPGQFVMIWVPSVDEKPMSVFQDQPLQLSIASVGYFSQAAHDLKKGSFVGVRGPFGNAFKLKGKRVAMVAGGYGAAPLYFLTQQAVDKKMEVVFIEGVRTKAHTLYQQELKKLPIEVEFSSDDGTIGFHGNSVQVLEQKMREKKFDCVYSCGPEKMMYGIVKLCEKNGVESQVSIERVMKCGFGACGACCVNNKLACYDGTIFTGAEALKLSEFGKAMRDASGTKKPL